jgi:hypothetical protein
MESYFKNSNAVKLTSWLTMNNDSLEQIVFLFVSRKNANGARYIPLFSKTRNVRIVFFRGLNIRYTDIIVSKMFVTIIKLFRFKIKKYKVIHFFNLNLSFEVDHQILHIDDPTYTENEINSILNWEKQTNTESKTTTIICTNLYTQDWLKTRLRYSNVIVVEQGFHQQEFATQKKSSNFICAYSSPYIHYGSDKFASHSTYGSNLLIGTIIPELVKLDPQIQVYLIGELGNNAKTFLKDYTNVKLFGRVSFEENMRILSTSTIGLYPRNIDHKRSMLKIFSYIGAGLPIVTFDLVDTRVVKDNSLGYSVAEVSEFIASITKLKSSTELLNKFRTNVDNFRVNYTWESLANKMEKLIGQS